MLLGEKGNIKYLPMPMTTQFLFPKKKTFDMGLDSTSEDHFQKVRLAEAAACRFHEGW